MAEITLIRHAESQANADRVFNGRRDGPLSEAGTLSLEPLSRRLRDQNWDVVITSPLERARQTAAAFTDDYEISPEFLEGDLGRWEGMSFDEVLSHHGGEFRKAIKSRDIPWGETGESLDDIARRVTQAADRLAERLGDNGKAAVVTHGGAIIGLLHRHLAGKKRRVHAFVGNTSMTRLTWLFGRPRLAVFNDQSHLDTDSSPVGRHLEAGDRVLALIRHGRTQANVERRWQGQGDWGLDDLGRRQADALAGWYGRHTAVFSSPLGRALQTAEYVALNGVTTVEDLKEVSMGDWEGLTSPEISEKWPGVLERIFGHGVDLKRGTSGESWGELTARFRNALDGLESPEGEPTVVVAHGGAIRSYIGSLTAVRDSHAESLFTPANTSVTHVAFTADGPLILDYAVAPHLETIS
jgi:broad specificity phosphatase PhoE